LASFLISGASIALILSGETRLFVASTFHFQFVTAKFDLVSVRMPKNQKSMQFQPTVLCPILYSYLLALKATVSKFEFLAHKIHCFLYFLTEVHLIVELVSHSLHFSFEWNVTISQRGHSSFTD
jgi:hypothetical protein